MAEQTTRERRGVKRAALYAAAFLLFLSGYITSYLGFMWLFGHGTIPKPAAIFLSDTVYAPVHGYQSQRYPGWWYLWTAETNAYWMGRGLPMPEAYRQMLDDAE